MIKPDGIARGLIGEIINRIEKKGLKIIAMKFEIMDKKIAEEHYSEHKGKIFYDQLIKFITSGPSLSLAVEGQHAINAMRILNGSTNPLEAAVGSIRGDFAIDTGRNIIHASDSNESAERELKIHFKKENIINYKIAIDDYIYEK